MRTWLARNLDDVLTIADPYFTPSELDWLQVIRSVKPECVISILTARAHQPKAPPGEELADVYTEAWRLKYDQAIPKTSIAVIGGEKTRQSPIHDRWIICRTGGLRLGTSLNSLGITKESEISEMTGEDAQDKLLEIQKYTNREVTEYRGENLRLQTFWL